VVSWAPDIYNLEKVKGNKILVTTGTANKLIADVWFARADFANDNPTSWKDDARHLRRDDRSQGAGRQAAAWPS
jgi:hypothetical protein